MGFFWTLCTHDVKPADLMRKLWKIRAEQFTFSDIYDKINIKVTES